MVVQPSWNRLDNNKAVGASFYLTIRALHTFLIAIVLAGVNVKFLKSAEKFILSPIMRKIITKKVKKFD
jgi:hypothetical protein